VLTDLPRRLTMHPYYEEIVTQAAKLYTNKEYAISDEWRQFCIDHLSYVHHNMMEPKDGINFDIYEHFQYKYNLAIIEADNQLLFSFYTYDTGEFSFMYQYMKDLLYNKPELIEKYIEEIANKFFIVKSLTLTEPEKSGKSLLAIIFLLRFFVNKYPLQAPFAIKKIVSKFQYFMNYPDPIGTDANNIFNQLVAEGNFPMLNHILYIRKNFPYIDYYSRFLADFNLEEPVLEMRTIFYSDTSNLAYQLLVQNSRMLKSNKGYKTLNAHAMRAKIIFHLLAGQNFMPNEVMKKSVAERLAAMDHVQIFDFYKTLCYYYEWVGNYPSNVLLNTETRKNCKEQFDKIMNSEAPARLTDDQRELSVSMLTSNIIVNENQMRYEFLSMNDYVKRPENVAPAAIDDEMVVIELKKFFKEQNNWLETSKLALSCRG
jgi:hypothetical protein